MEKKKFVFIINGEELVMEVELPTNLTVRKLKEWVDNNLKQKVIREMKASCLHKWGPGYLTHLRSNYYKYEKALVLV